MTHVDDSNVGDSYPDVCDSAVCACEAVGYLSPRGGAPRHLVFDDRPIEIVKKAADCDSGLKADHIIHHPGRCRCGPPYGSQLTRGGRQ